MWVAFDFGESVGASLHGATIGSHPTFVNPNARPVADLLKPTGEFVVVNQKRALLWNPAGKFVCDACGHFTAAVNEIAVIRTDHHGGSW